MTFTVAEAGAPTWGDEDDGFPEVDDLADATLGQYRLGRIIGRGSMGRVYRGEHLSLARPCAIKVMNPGLVARKPKIRERFWAEARAVANLVHPHVVTVHNLGNDRGYHYIEMEYVPGGVSLKEALDPRGGVRAGPGLDAGPAGRPGARGRARLGAGPPRCEALQRPAHRGGAGQARRLRPGAATAASCWSRASRSPGPPPTWRPSCSRGFPPATVPTSTPSA